MLRKTLQAIAVGALAITVIHGPAGAETSFKALGGVAAEPMSATEIEATQGKAIVDAYWSGQYFVMQDDQFSYPFKFDRVSRGAERVSAAPGGRFATRRQRGVLFPVPGRPARVDPRSP